MFTENLIAATGVALALFITPVAAQTIDVDREAMIPAAQQGDVIVELDEQRGGEQLIVTNQTLTAITQGNVLNGGFLAGDVNLSDSALSSFNGVGNILINTGAQVSLQTGMNLTINIGE
jgi:hypothetical protein